MLLMTSLNALPRRQAERFARRLQRFTGNTAMNDRVPYEVHVQERPHVVAIRLFDSPSFDAHVVECNYLRAFGLLRFGITLKQISDILHYFVAELYPHALFRQRAKERLQHQLPTVSAFVAREIRCQTLQLVTRNKGTICADDNVVQVVADRQLFAQCRIVEFSFVLFKSYRHCYSSLRYADRISWSRAIAQ